MWIDLSVHGDSTALWSGILASIEYTKHSAHEESCECFLFSIVTFSSYKLIPVYVNVNVNVCVIVWYPIGFRRLHNLHPWYWNSLLHSLISSGENSAHFLQLMPFTILHFSFHQIPITGSHPCLCFLLCFLGGGGGRSGGGGGSGGFLQLAWGGKCGESLGSPKTFRGFGRFVVLRQVLFCSFFSP